MRPEPNDRLLRDAVLRALMSDTVLASLELHVGTSRGVVHLSGRAPTLEVRARAEQVVTSIAGVRAVVNRIEAPGAPCPSRIINLNFSRKKKQEKRRRIE